MRRLFRRVLACLLVAAGIWGLTVLRDRAALDEGLIRLHVVAASDGEADQAVKLQVRDAITRSLRRDLEAAADVEAARAYLLENLDKLQAIANDALEKAGVSDRAQVCLGREAFDTRYYDTFALPAGVYESLRVVIGEGQGHNWWCVVFPELCLPATAQGFEDAAAGAGFSDGLSAALTGREQTNIRFFLLDALGRGEAALFRDSF